MVKGEQERKQKRGAIVTIIVISTLSIVAVIIVAAVLILTWPNKVDSLQQQFTVDPSLSYDSALKRVAEKKKSDKNRTISDDRASYALTHKKKTKRSVIVFHGITASPHQYRALAKKFYEAGYNVYVPLAPFHGTGNNDDLAQITSDDLREYVIDSVEIATALGEETGVVGISGGAVLATWALQRSDTLSSALLLSPFYAPATHHAPSWLLNPLITLHGNRLIPDSKNGEFSLRTLASYLLFTKNYAADFSAPQLKHIAVVTSELDTDINLDLAHSIPRSMAITNSSSLKEYRISKEFGVTHDTVDPSADGMKEHGKQLTAAYLSLYENKKPKQ